jgi:hypothetical protein
LSENIKKMGRKIHLLFVDLTKAYYDLIVKIMGIPEKKQICAENSGYAGFQRQ